MFVKRDDGLETSFLPYDIGGFLLAILWTVRCGVRGWLAVPVFVGFWLCGFAAVLVGVYLLILLFSLTIDMKAPPPEKDSPVHRAIVLFVISNLCRFARVRIHCTGEETLPEGRFFLVSNHRSAYDPITTVWALRKRALSIVTKPENLRIPLAGPMIYRCGFLPINREDPREAMKTINAAAKLIQNNVASVGIYPEGTRNKTPEAGLLPFHNGVFKIAQKANVPVVVVSVTGTENIRRNFPWKHTDVYLRVCEVIPAEEVRGGTAAVSERVRGILEAQRTQALT